MLVMTPRRPVKVKVRTEPKPKADARPLKDRLADQLPSCGRSGAPWH